MEIEIPDSGLRAICEQERTATKKLGRNCARKLRARLADLQAAVSVHELVAGRPHSLRGDRLGQFSVDLHGGVRLVFEPANDPIPEFEHGGIDWRKVTQVRIVFIGDYHD